MYWSELLSSSNSHILTSQWNTIVLTSSWVSSIDSAFCNANLIFSAATIRVNPHRSLCIIKHSLCIPLGSTRSSMHCPCSLNRSPCLSRLYPRIPPSISGINKVTVECLKSFTIHVQVCLKTIDDVLTGLITIALCSQLSDSHFSSLITS